MPVAAITVLRTGIFAAMSSHTHQQIVIRIENGTTKEQTITTYTINSIKEFYLRFE